MADAVDSLAAADRAYREADRAVEEIGEADLEQLAEVYDEFVELIEQYEEPASGSGGETFQAYVEFEGKLADFEESIPDNLRERETIEAAAELLDRRRLEERDFEKARDRLAPVRELVDRLDDREEFRQRYREARRNVRRRIRDLDQRIDELESLLEFAEVDFDAPIDRLREPIDHYNDRVTESFETFRRQAPVTDVLGVIGSAADRPLIDMRAPPSELRSYLRSNPVGEKPIPQLIEWTDFSRSKLGHYVEDPQTFLGRVGANRTYLDRLDADPLTIDWPPPPAEELRWRIRELVPIIDQFAGAETIGALRTVREITRDPAYSRLRETAEALETLDERDRERLASGAIERDLEAARDERERLQEALSEYPNR